MGRLSDKQRSSRRPSRRSRAKVKTHHRAQASGFVGGAIRWDIHPCGRKKFHRLWLYLNRVTDAHLGGEALTLKSVRVIERPLYKIILGPSIQGHDMEPKGAAVNGDG